MKISQKIVDKILTDNDFSLELAKKLKITQDAVFKRAKRHSERLLTPICMEFYQEKGFTKEEIIEQ